MKTETTNKQTKCQLDRSHSYDYKTNNPAIFITDYASYNDGTQFEFGHWVDLTTFEDADDVNNYIHDHLAQADEISPLDNYGSKREEIMITDYENFPSEFYWESGCDFEKIFKYIELDYDNLEDYQKVEYWNEYCQNNAYDDQIYEFDDDFFEIFFSGTPMECARASSFGNLNWSDNYIRFDGNGNLESLSNPLHAIDEGSLIEYLMNK